MRFTNFVFPIKNIFKIFGVWFDFGNSTIWIPCQGCAVCKNLKFEFDFPAKIIFQKNFRFRLIRKSRSLPFSWGFSLFNFENQTKLNWVRGKIVGVGYFEPCPHQVWKRSGGPVIITMTIRITNICGAAYILGARSSSLLMQPMLHEEASWYILLRCWICRNLNSGNSKFDVYEFWISHQKHF